MDEQSPTGPLTAAEFFAMGMEGANPHRAMLSTGLAYTTILRARDTPETTTKDTAKKLDAWSRMLPVAVERGVWIDAGRMLGVTPDARASIPDDERPTLTPTDDARAA